MILNKSYLIIKQLFMFILIHIELKNISLTENQVYKNAKTLGINQKQAINYTLC